MVAEPRDAQYEGILTEGGDECGEHFHVVADFKRHFDDFGDVARADGTTIDYLEGARHAELVTRQVVLVYKLLVDKGKSGCTAINHSLRLDYVIFIHQRAINNKMSAV
jgi:hypothetical protein